MPIAPDADVLRYATPGQTGADLPPTLLGRTSLQLAHRALSLGLVLFVAGVGACAAGKGGAPLLLWSFAAGDVALLGGFVSLASHRKRGRLGRESLVTAAVAGGLAMASFVLYLLFRASRSG